MALLCRNCFFSPFPSSLVRKGNFHRQKSGRCPGGPKRGSRTRTARAEAPWFGVAEVPRPPPASHPRPARHTPAQPCTHPHTRIQPRRLIRGEEAKSVSAGRGRRRRRPRSLACCCLSIFGCVTEGRRGGNRGTSPRRRGRGGATTRARAHDSLPVPSLLILTGRRRVTAPSGGGSASL